MFSYYGSKSKIIHLYPPPKHDVIVEPFAGSARYSLLHWERVVILTDTSEYVFAVWRYLIEASEKDVLSLPDVPSGKSLDDYKQLSDAERWLIGFHLCRGKAKPRKVGHGQNSWARDKVRIARDLYKIRHFHVFPIAHDYGKQPPATYFIDPPYQKVQTRPGNSDRYPQGSLDYARLGEWIKSLPGQVIACEGEGADYLPFQPLATVNTNTNNRGVKKNTEMIYLQG